jgi:regulation of enolase protein 1 (concanavalin A-like superfamily)
MVDFTFGKWIFEPKVSQVAKNFVSITTEPETDFWQRSYYGFRNNNAPALQIESEENFTFTAKVSFKYEKLFDQCGLIIYLDEDNWFKAAIEYENETFSRLGSVVTNFGYSDWATSDISLPTKIWYRLSRRGPDFLIESSLDGIDFKQMRIFHLHKLGETTLAMGMSNPPLPASKKVSFGVYACSPSKSSFTATFTDMKLETCKWSAHAVED